MRYNERERRREMKMKKLMFLLVLSLSFLLLGCGEVLSDYHEVHLIVVEDQPFYYIDPGEGKDTLSSNQFGPGETRFVYLYEAEDGVEFGYDQYFSTIQERYVENNLKDGKMYVRSSPEIDNLIQEYFANKPE